MRLGSRVWLAAWLLFAGCNPGEHHVFVQLVTDYAPLAEFDDIVVTTASGTQHVAVTLGSPYGRGVRVASVTAAEGEVHASITLSRQGLEVQTQTRRTRVSGDTTVLSVRISRTCHGVTCSDPLASACLAGRCVPDDCTPEHPENCPAPMCSATAGGTPCGDPVPGCTVATCVEEGTCVDVPHDERCGAGEVCVPTAGCAIVLLPDAGASDASVDASIDGGADVGVDAGSDADVDASTFHAWQPTWAQVAPLSDAVHGIAADAGRVFVSVGCNSGESFGGPAIASHGDVDACVIAYDGATGAYLWGTALGSPTAELPGGIAAANGGVFVSYSFFTNHTVATALLSPRGVGDLAVVRLDATTGTPVWATATGGDPFGDDYPASVRIADDGMIAAYSGVPVSGTSAPFVPWIGRLSPESGVLLLDRTIAAARMLSVNAIAAGGGIAICGSYGGGDFGDGMPTGSGTSRALAALYDTAGTIAWTRTLDSPSYATATDCVESGRLYVVGGFRTSVGTITGTIDGTSTGTAYDGFAAAINLDGSIEWLARSGVDIVAQPFVTRVGSRLYAIVESNMGSTWGHFTGASALGIAELSTTSSTPIGDATFPVALVPYGVAGDASTGRVYVLGMGSSSFTWGATAHTVSSVSSIVLALDP